MFSNEEYNDRIRKTKQKMESEGIEVLLITNPANMNYLTGYDGWAFYVHQLLIVALELEEPIWAGRQMDANGAKMTTWLKPENIISYTDEYVQSAERHPMDFICSILKDKRLLGKSIAAELDTYYFSSLCYERLQNGMPNVQFKNGTGLVNHIRMIKSETEIEYMKRAARLVENAMRTGVDSLAPGVRECDVAADIYHAQISGTEEFGGDYPAIVPLMPSGKKTSSPHLTWTDERYKPDDTVILELAGCYKRYHSPLARTIILGQPSLHVRELADVVLEGLNETLAIIRPGITCEMVEEKWRKTIARHGYQKDSRIGYSVGLNYPPDWGEHTASLRQGDKTILQPNMTFHIIPGIWFEDYGVEFSETFRVTESGCEILANFPRDLICKTEDVPTIPFINHLNEGDGAGI
ncbi:M24 family metallopeptidase [Evansella clarkii]|jgi:Xaa-Pro dipeptidase|uniref:M24 family metallopeptidase n=1 Tax=Evansella clarkii TaxID=79879 RepID=UPI00099891AA|nr:M24 family metallopeptidase [Evansella clarkii]